MYTGVVPLGPCQIELDDALVLMPRRPPLMLLIDRFANSKRVIQIAEPVRAQQLRNFVRCKLRVIAHDTSLFAAASPQLRVARSYFRRLSTKNQRDEIPQWAAIFLSICRPAASISAANVARGSEAATTACGLECAL